MRFKVIYNSIFRENHPLKKLETVGFKVDSYLRVYVEPYALGEGYDKSHIMMLGAATERDDKFFR